jgi:hypothetical protein
LLFCVTTGPPAAAVPLTETVWLAEPLVNVTVPLLIPSVALLDSLTLTVVADSVPFAVMLLLVPHELPLSVDTSNPDVTVTDTFAVKFAPLTVKLPVLLPADPTVPSNAVSPVRLSTVSDGVDPPAA